MYNYVKGDADFDGNVYERTYNKEKRCRSAT